MTPLTTVKMPDLLEASDRISSWNSDVPGRNIRSRLPWANASPFRSAGVETDSLDKATVNTKNRIMTYTVHTTYCMKKLYKSLIHNA